MSEDRETPAAGPAPDAQSEESTPTPPATAAAAPHTEPGAAHEAANANTSETPAGAPVEENQASTTELLAAVDRAGELPVDATTSADSGAHSHDAGVARAAVTPDVRTDTTALASAEAAGATPTTALPEERAPIVLPDEMPSAGPAAPVAPPVREEPAERILISADHPMAALYMQTPMPPDLRGNRGAGVLIALLATLVFAVIYAGALALWLAPTTPPSTFVSTLLQFGLWPAVASTTAFFIGLVLVVLVVGRAGWWAYVLGGFLVGVLVWAAAVAGIAFTANHLDGATRFAELFGTDPATGYVPIEVLRNFGLTLPALAAGLIAREVMVWFGAWIGARGRRVTRSNAEAIAEYEAALAEAQTKQP